MAKPTWLTVQPSTSSGNGTIKNIGTEHTGRVARKGTVTVTAVGVHDPVTYNVTQKPKAEFVSFTNGPEMSYGKEQGTLSVTGKSNSSKLTFALVGDGKNVEIPAQYTAAGNSTNNGQPISGDPGASAEYDFSIDLSVPKNDSVEEITRTIKVTANGNQAAQIIIRQTAGDARIKLTGLSGDGITLESNGSAVSVGVESNTTWSVS